MSRRTELIALLVADGVALGAACVLALAGGPERGLGRVPVFGNASVWFPLLLLNTYWLALLAFSGFYRARYASSRFDEIVSLSKVVALGMLVLVFAIYAGMVKPGVAPETLLRYSGLVLVFVTCGRLVVRSIQKAVILKGHGAHRALIVGWSDRVEQLHHDVAQYPAAGLKIVGAIRMSRDEDITTANRRAVAFASDEVSGGDGAVTLTRLQPVAPTYAVDALPVLIDELGVQDVLIALGSEDHDALLRVLRLCDGKPVSLKLVPDFYTIIGGMARTEHMYGLPLIEVLPEPMPDWQMSAKRLIDVLVSAVVLIVGFPVWMLIGLMVRCSSPGPVIYRQQRVGWHGSLFTMYKFRTMPDDAELFTGPVWATENDPRYTAVGKWLRATRLDEIPQFWNVLKGEMSLVGPRPERPFFVENLAEEIPLYSRRHRVKPGITGWAQVKWKYDSSLDDVRQKVKYDLFYIENMSLQMDLQILLTTIRTALSGVGR